MIIIGLTGSIGMGKTTTAALFAEEGVPVYDADAAVHALYDGEASAAVEAAFPGVVEDGRVNRTLLGERVIGNKAELAKLEAIIHPMVHAKERLFLEQNRDAGTPIVVLDIPLLFETGGEARVDKVVVVSAGEEVQRTRVMARPGMTEDRFQAILAKQMPDQEKCERADFVINTADGIEPAREQARAILDILKNTPNG